MAPKPKTATVARLVPKFECAPDAPLVKRAPKSVPRRASTKPNVTIRLQPSEATKVSYLPLAPTKAGGKGQWKLIIGIHITNNEPDEIVLNSVKFTFPNSNQADHPMQHIDRVIDPIPAGESAWWSNGNIPDSELTNAVYRDLPAPAGVRVHLGFAGFTDEIAITCPLIPHQAPVAQGSYLFPLSASDLDPGEYYWTSATHWANGQGRGTQIYAHDIGCVRLNSEGEPTGLASGGKDSKNGDYLIYGKPVRAMADGEIIDLHDGLAENTPPGFPEVTPDPSSGNFVRIRHGRDLIRYCHLQPGSLPADIRKNARVVAGQMLGRAGNTGRSSAPHLHIEAVEEDLGLHPIPLRDTWVLDHTELNSDRGGPWEKLSGEGIPNRKVLIWPAKTRPGYYPPHWGEVSQISVREDHYQTWFNRANDSNYRPEWVDAYEVGGKTYFNALYRWDDGAFPWKAAHNLTADGYQELFDEYAGKGYRLTNLTSYLDDGKIRYACIFAKKSGPAWTAYHGLSADDHQKQFEALEQQGYRPVNVAVVSVNGKRSYAAFYDKANVGAWVLKSFLTPSEYDQEWDTQGAAGRRVVYLSAYRHDGGTRFSAIFQALPAGTSGRHNLTTDEASALINEKVGQGKLTRCVAGYALVLTHQFAVVWR